VDVTKDPKNQAVIPKKNVGGNMVSVRKARTTIIDLYEKKFPREDALVIKKEIKKSSSFSPLYCWCFLFGVF
jgi:hypothetical protein